MVDDEAILDVVERNRDEPRHGGARARRRREQGRRRGQHHRRSSSRSARRSRRTGDRCPRSPTTQPADDEERTLTEARRASRPIDDTMVVLRATSSRRSRHRRRARAAAAAEALIARRRRRRASWSWPRSSSGASRARTSSASSRTATSPSTRASRGTSSAACGCTAIRYESPVLAGQLSQAERRKLFDHDLRSYDRALGPPSSSTRREVVP